MCQRSPGERSGRILPDEFVRGGLLVGLDDLDVMVVE